MNLQPIQRTDTSLTQYRTIEVFLRWCMRMGERDSSRGVVGSSGENDTQDIVVVSLCVRKTLQNQ
jgi:hypothetical protein